MGDFFSGINFESVAAVAIAAVILGWLSTSKRNRNTQGKNKDNDEGKDEETQEK